MDWDHAIFYNENSAARLGWKPQWFGCQEIDDQCCRNIQKYQRLNNLVADGLCGPSTYRRIYASMQADNPAMLSDHSAGLEHGYQTRSIVYGGHSYQIDWPKVVLWTEDRGFAASSDHYKTSSDRDIRFMVNHWDVCLNSTSCFKVLENRGLSVHFLLDYDGTIYQTMDMMDIAYHAGGRNWNTCSIGVEINNPFYLKYQSWYQDRGLERPIVSKARVHGQPLETHLGFFDVQLRALRVLTRAVSDACDIPLQTPDTLGVDSECTSCQYRGFIQHYHLKANKIDCASLDLKQIIGD